MKKFLIFCSGASSEYLKMCPESESNKYVSVGSSILLTAIFSSMAAFYALLKIFSSVPLALFVAFLWGFLIFNIDRLITISMAKHKSKLAEFFAATPRILIAVLIGITIARPIEIALFSHEIDQELLKKKQQTISELKKNIDSQRNSETSILEKQQENFIKQKNQLEKGLSVCETDLSGLQKSYLGECDGTTGTKKRGDGPICKIKKSAYYEKKSYCDGKYINKDIDLLEFKGKISTISTKINDINHKYEERREKDISETENKFSESFLSSHEVLSELSNKKSIGIATFFITLLFIFIETAPVLTKLFSRRGPYDEFLDMENEIAAKIAMELKKTKLYDSQYSSVESEIRSILENLKLKRVKLRQDIENTLRSHKGKVSNELAKKIIKDWKSHSKKKSNTEEIEKLEKYFSGIFSESITKTKAKSLNIKNSITKPSFTETSLFIIVLITTVSAISLVVNIYGEVGSVIMFFVLYALIYSIVVKTIKSIKDKKLESMEGLISPSTTS